jgi:hypothetical protein
MGYSREFSRSLLSTLWRVAWSDSLMDPEEMKTLLDTAERYGGTVLRQEVELWLDGLQPVPEPHLDDLKAERSAVLREVARMILADRLIEPEEKQIFSDLRDAFATA